MLATSIIDGRASALEGADAQETVQSEAVAKSGETEVPKAGNEAETGATEDGSKTVKEATRGKIDG